MESFPREIHCLITHLLSEKQWMRWALASSETHKIVCPSVQNLAIQSNKKTPECVPISCIRHWAHLFSEVKTLNCLEVTPVGIQKNYEALRFLITRPTTLLCKSGVLSLIGHNLTLPRLSILSLEYPRRETGALTKKIFTPLIEILSNVHPEDDWKILNQPLPHLKQIELVIEPQNSSFEWIRAISKLHQIELYVTLHAFIGSDPSQIVQLARLLAAELALCTNITSFTIRSIYSYSVCLVAFSDVLSAASRPIRHIDIVMMIEDPGFDMIRIMSANSKDMNKFKVSGAFQRIITGKQPPEMSNLRYLKLQHLVLPKCEDGNPIKLVLPLLTKLSIMEQCKGGISPKSDFPSLESLYIKYDLSINNLLQVIEDTSTKLKKVDVLHPRDVIVTKHIESITIRCPRDTILDSYLMKIPASMTIKIPMLSVISKLLQIKPPLRHLIINPTNGCEIQASDFDTVKESFPSATICINKNSGTDFT